MTEPKPNRDAVTIRPRKVRVVCWVLAVAVVALFAVVAIALTGTMGEGMGTFQRSDQVAMLVLGLLVAGGILLFTRPRVVVDADGIRVRNVVGGHDLPWGVVRQVRFDRGNPWLSLELEDDELVAVMAVQAADRQYAVRAAQTIRDFHAAHRARRPRP